MTDQTLIQIGLVFGLIIMVYSIPFIIGDKKDDKDQHAHWITS